MAIRIPVLLVPLLVLSVGSASGQDTGAIVDGDLAREVDAYLTRLEPFGFSGAALVIRNDATILRKGYGLADREAGIPATTATVFSLGSITKQFTAAAILALEEAGELSVRDSIGRYFPDVPDDKRGITIHHLLTHSSGLESDFAEGDFTPEGADRDGYVRLALDSRLLFAPGTGYEYSNAGYSLLAAIVEIVSGEPYEEALRELVFLPAGMQETGYRIPAWDPSRIAVGYREGERWGTVVERYSVPGGPFWQLRGNGGLHTTLLDVERWTRALETDAVLDGPTRARMFTPYVPENPDSSSWYGYGWAIEDTPRHGRLVWHNGGNGIFLAELHRWVDEGLTVFVVSSDPALSAGPVSGAVEGIAFGEPYEEPPVVVPLAPESLARVTGSWRLPSGESLLVAAKGDHLVLSSRGRGGLALLHPLSERARELASDVEARTKPIVEGVLGRDYAPLAEAFRAIPIEGIRGAEEAIRSRREARLGAPAGYEIVGAVPRGPGLAVVVRYDFAGGSAWNQYVWGPDGITGVFTSEEAPTSEYWPVAPDAFESFQIRGPAGPRVELREADGRATLVIEAPEGPVEARRP